MARRRGRADRRLLQSQHPPSVEHQRRYDTLLEYAGRIGLPLIGEPLYDVKGWLRQVQGKEEKGVRCRVCISQRLRHTAELGAAAGLDAFSTTLLISPWQEHEIIREEGERAAAEFGIAFRYRDLRPAYRRSVELSAKRASIARNIAAASSARRKRQPSGRPADAHQ